MISTLLAMPTGNRFHYGYTVTLVVSREVVIW